MWTVFIAFLIFNIVCTIILLIADALNIDVEEILTFLCTGLITIPILIIATIIKKIKAYKQLHNGIFIAQKHSKEYENPFCEVIVPYKYYEHFRESENWDIIKRYPKKEELYAGFSYTDNKGNHVVRAYDLRKINENDIQEVLNEKNCFHCKHNGIECNEDKCLCTTDIYGKIIEHDKYNRNDKITER